jgi:transcriptional regulator with XRE-family HTH domain
VNAERSLWQRGVEKPEKEGWRVIRSPEFAERFNHAADMNPNVPPMRQGRYVYIKDQLAKRGQEVSVESIRKWFSGESMPHKDRVEHLAEVLKVDASWLMLGEDASDTPQQRRARNAMVSGAVNFVAGIAQMDGAVVAFPEDDDRFAIAQHIDLHAIIRGANYPLHVIVAEEREGGQIVFSVPTDLRNTVPIGVMRLEGFNFSVFEITDEAIELGTPGQRGKIEVNVRSQGVREITSFKERF